MRVVYSLLIAGVLSRAALAFAEPLLAAEDGGPAPAVVVAWSGEGKKIELTLRDDVDAGEVAAAIETALDRVKVKVKAGKLLVIGMARDDLLSALTEVELGGDDLDVLAEAALSEDDFDSGSSLRAKKAADLSALLKDRKATAVGRVVAVTRGTFPKTRVAVRILRGPTGALGKTVYKGQTIRFFPLLRMKDGRPDLSDEATVTNIGAWFLKPNDQVRIGIGTAVEGGYRAKLITR